MRVIDEWTLKLVYFIVETVQDLYTQLHLVVIFSVLGHVGSLRVQSSKTEDPLKSYSLKVISDESNLCYHIQVVLNFLVIVSWDTFEKQLAYLFCDPFILIAEVCQSFSEFFTFVAFSQYFIYELRICEEVKSILGQRVLLFLFDITLSVEAL